MTETLDERLARAGDALYHAWRHDAARAPTAHRRGRLVLVAIAVAFAVGAGAAIASSILKIPSDEQAGMREADTLFAGSDPHCVTTAAAAFRCTLARTPQGETFYRPDGTQLLNVFLGMKMETVDAAHRVDGGCISRSADGVIWDCYLGHEAVTRGIVSEQRLGQLSPGPVAG